MNSCITCITRRQFLRSAAASGTLAAMATLGVSAMPDEKDQAMDLPIVDTHQHLWDLDKFRLPWTSGVPALSRSFLLADYARAADGLNIVKTVYMEVDVDPAQQTDEARYVLTLCRQKDSRMAGAVISGRPASRQFAAYLDQFGEQPHLKGVRQVLHTREPAGYCLQPEFIRGVRLLGERGLSYDICMRPAELPDACKLIDACPDTRFILDHCGNPSVKEKNLAKWKKDVAEVAKRPSVMCKVSGLVDKANENWSAEDLAPVVRHVWDVFGPDRLMFGGDWPVCTLRASLRQWVHAVKQIVADRPLAEQRKLFHDNAVRFYELA